MNSLVLNEFVYTAESLPAVFALVVFLPSVEPLVLGELVATPEGLATVFAFVGFLPSMDSFMNNEA